MGATPDADPRSHATAAGAIRLALAAAMAADDGVIVLGDAVGALGGAHHTTRGLRDQFGADRVIDAPLSEAGLVGLAVGLALGGKRPVVELSDAGRAWAAAEQIVRELGSLPSEFAAPVVLRLPCGGPVNPGPVEDLLAAAPGLTVAAPATPADAGGLLRSALRARGPVALLEPVALYGERGPVDDAPAPLGRARVARAGDHVTVLTWGGVLPAALEGAERAAERGLSAEVLDLRTLSPLDVDAVRDSARRTGRLLVAAPGPGAFVSAVLAAATRAAFLYLEAPPAALDHHPDATAIADAIASSVWF
jgi:pyruvate/2-oxoglutarate/acetoin dehydrogenase E1 component